MKKLNIVTAFMLLAVVAKGQDCYEPLNNLGVSVHYTTKGGIGASFGNIGRESNWSFLLSGEVTRSPGKKDSTTLTMGPKVLYRFARTEGAYFQVVAHPAIIGVNLGIALGARAMCIIGRRVAVYGEPLYWLSGKVVGSVGVVTIF